MDILRTLAELQTALATTPLDATLHREMAEAQRLRGDLYTAHVHAIAAGALTLYAAEPARQAQELCTIATAYFTNADYKIAATLYRLVLAIAPDMAVPYMNLAAMCAAAGFPDDADACRRAPRAAAQRRPQFRQRADRSDDADGALVPHQIHHRLCGRGGGRAAAALRPGVQRHRRARCRRAAGRAAGPFRRALRPARAERAGDDTAHPAPPDASLACRPGGRLRRAVPAP